MGKIHELPKSSAHLLTSTQIITSVHCIVKELIENAFDSSSKNVEVKLVDYGLEKIEVKDNGTGIDKNDIQFVARPHFTSKIASYSDLEEINTYGFRGEALGAICAVANLVITTKSSNESIGNIVNFGHDGQVVSSKPFPCAQGTTVSVQNLFKNLPVRKQYYRSEKNKKEELKKVEEILIAYGCIQFDVRFALYHNKNLIWQKPALSNTRNALIHILGSSVVDHMEYIEHTDEQTKRKIELFLPKLGAPLACGLNTSSRTIISVNTRPVRIKEVDKLLKEHYNQSIQNSGKSRYPISFISFTTPSKEVDVNVEPSKTNVMLHHADEILAQFSEMLRHFYSTEEIDNNAFTAENSTLNQAQKSNSEEFLNSLKKACSEKVQQTKLAFAIESPLYTKNSENIVSSIENNHNAIRKEDTIVCTPKEPSKKKLKSSSKISKGDINNHLNTLDSFFSSTNENQDSVSAVPRVTVERISSNQSSLNSDSGTISSFAVSSNLCSDSNSIFRNNALNRSLHDNNLVSDIPKISSSNCERISTFAVNSNLCSKGNSVSENSLKNHSLNSNSFLCDMDIVEKDIATEKTKVVRDSLGQCSNDNSVSKSGVESRKRHLSDSSISAVKLDEDILKRSALDLDTKNGDPWSRGVPAVCGQFQPVKILQPKIVTLPESNSNRVFETNESKKKTPEKSNGCIERKLTAFHIFCLSNRLEVAAENPELNNQQIAQILTQKWNRLPLEEKAVFKNIEYRDYQQAIRNKEKLGKKISKNLNREKNDISPQKMLRRKMKPKVKDKAILFSVEDIRNLNRKKNGITASSNNLTLINCLTPGIWVCSKEEKLLILNTFRLQEAIIYYRLLETFHFECQPLDVPHNINSSHVGDKGMEVLLQLGNFEENTSCRILNEKILANGFDIKISKGFNNNVAVELLGITSFTAFYGMPDLKEILLLIKNKGLSAKLSECRPGKILLHLQSEANRMSKKSPACQRIQDVEDLLKQKSYLPVDCNKCLHYKDFFTEIYKFLAA